MDPEESAIRRRHIAETRRYARFEILEYAMVYHPDSIEPVRSVVVNVGLGGVQILSRQQLQVGDICHVDLPVTNGGRMAVPGEVRFSRPFNDSSLFSTGMRFVPENHEQKSQLADYVHSVFQRQADLLSG